MVAQLDHLNQLAVGTGAGHFETMGGELLAELVVELEAMAMAFMHDQALIRLMRLAPLGQLAGVGAQAHRAPLVGNRVLIVQHADHGIAAIAVEFRAIGVLQADHVAREFDDGTLKAQADAKERHVALTRIADGVDLATGAAVIEAAATRVRAQEHRAVAVRDEEFVE